MSASYAIEAKGIWKRYGLPLRQALRQRLDGWRGQEPDRQAYGPWALQDLSFAIEPGESLGIVGRNGAGKSTLLKLIAGVSPATYGSLKVKGRLFPMIELAAGIHRDLTGRENIKLLGAIMGFSSSQMEARMPAVLDFAELGEWLDKPVWQYSSGMQARLGFSVAVNVDADILLVDEVLSVGDISFQKKCLNRMDELANSGVTIVFVTHNPYSIERLCQRAIFIQDGTLAASGSPKEILSAYFERTMDRSTEIKGRDSLAEHRREGTGAFRVTDISLRDALTGREISAFTIGDTVLARIRLKVGQSAAAYRFALRIVDPAGTVISYINLPGSSAPPLRPHENCALECRIENINLLPGQYWLDAIAWETGGPLIDSVRYAYSFNVLGSRDVLETLEARGIVYLPASWRLADEPASS